MKDPRHPLALRIPSEQLEAIDKRARQAQLTRTEYMVRAALGEITDPRDADTRLEDIDQRLQRLERWMELSN